MGTDKTILRSMEDGTLEFGDHASTHKEKVDNFEFEGDIYKVKTFHDVTKLDKNGMFVYESVPGSTVTEYHASATEVNFKVASFEDVQITLELEPNQEYETFVNDRRVGVMLTNVSGKLTFSVELNPGEVASVLVKKC
jgi:hypothetical protein